VYWVGLPLIFLYQLTSRAVDIEKKKDKRKKGGERKKGKELAGQIE